VHPVTDAEQWFLQGVQVCLLLLQGWAFIDCISRGAAAFPAAGKLTKPAWLGITLLAFAIQLWLGLTGFLFLTLIGMVASMVYLTDVRPAVREVSGPSRW
jgi:hypothetical protein